MSVQLDIDFLPQWVDQQDAAGVPRGLPVIGK